MTPDKFEKRMQQISVLISKNLDAGFRATAIAIDQAVVLATPVDTGRARANWRVSSSSPDTSTVDKPSSPAAGAASALAEGKRVIDTDQTGVIYISNNLPYIGALNDGSSAQAPAGFVELAVQAGAAQAGKIKALDGA